MREHRRPYKLVLSEEDLATIVFVGTRYGWSEALAGLEAGENELTESEAYVLGHHRLRLSQLMAEWKGVRSGFVPVGETRAHPAGPAHLRVLQPARTPTHNTLTGNSLQSRPNRSPSERRKFGRTWWSSPGPNAPLRPS